MYKDKKILLMMPAYNDADNVREVLKKVPTDLIDDFVVVNDGSKDNTKEVIEQGLKQLGKGTLIHFEKNRGLGPGFKAMFSYAKETNCDVGVIIAGDNQDDPGEIINLVKAVVDEGYDMIQGSRYIEKKREPIPLKRLVTTRLYSFVFSVLTGQWITDASNGFKAFKLSMLNEVDMSESWLDDKYGIEQYFLACLIRQGKKVKEVPVKKYYPPNYSKMRMSTDWWKIIKPIFKSLRY